MQKVGRARRWPLAKPRSVGDQACQILRGRGGPWMVAQEGRRGLSDFHSGWTGLSEGVAGIDTEQLRVVPSTRGGRGRCTAHIPPAASGHALVIQPASPGLHRQHREHAHRAAGPGAWHVLL